MPIGWRKSVLRGVEPWRRDSATSDGSDYEPAPKAEIGAVEDGAGRTSLAPIPAYREAALAYCDAVCTSNIWPRLRPARFAPAGFGICVL